MWLWVLIACDSTVPEDTALPGEVWSFGGQIGESGDDGPEVDHCVLSAGDALLSAEDGALRDAILQWAGPVRFDEDAVGRVELEVRSTHFGQYTSLDTTRSCPEAPWVASVDVEIIHPDFSFRSTGVATAPGGTLEELWAGLVTDSAPTEPPAGLFGTPVWAATLTLGGGALGWWSGDESTGQVQFVSRDLGWTPE